LRIHGKEKYVKDQILADMEACSAHQLEMRITPIFIHENVSQCFERSFRSVMSEISLDENSVVGEASPIEMDNEIVERIINRKF
jgi:hypothetical protein